MKNIPFLCIVIVFCSMVLLLGINLELAYCNDSKRLWIHGSAETIKNALSVRDINRHDDEGMTPLHYVAQYNSGEAIFTLLANGADVNAKTSHERTPLMMAAMANDHKDSILTLVAFGADRNAKDLFGKTALILAVEKEQGWAILELLRYGANPFIKDNDEKTALDYIRNKNSLLGSEARRQLIRYSDHASGLFRPDIALPQQTDLPWWKGEVVNSPKVSPQIVHVESVPEKNALPQNNIPAKVELEKNGAILEPALLAAMPPPTVNLEPSTPSLPEALTPSSASSSPLPQVEAQNIPQPLATQHIQSLPEKEKTESLWDKSLAVIIYLKEVLLAIAAIPAAMGVFFLRRKKNQINL